MVALSKQGGFGKLMVKVHREGNATVAEAAWIWNLPSAD